MVLRLSGLLLACLLIACSPAVDPSAAEGQEEAEGGGGFTFPVTYVEAVAGEIVERSEFAADIRSRREGELSFERAGRLAERFVDEGDEVVAGQLLARLDDVVLEAEHDAAVAAVEAAEAQWAYAKLELERAEGMAAAEADTVRDQWRSEVAIRGATLRQRQAEVLRLERQLEQGQLTAPFDGTLVERGMLVGGHVAAGEMVFKIVDRNQREARVELPQSIAVGLTGAVTIELLRADGSAVPLALDAILPSASSGTRTFTGLARFDRTLDPTGSWPPGAFAKARLITRQAQSDTLVPVDALLESPQGTLVVVAAGEPPMAQFVPVRILARDPDMAAVEPLQEGSLVSGNRVVVTGSDNVFPGAPLLLHAHRQPTAGDATGQLAD